MATSVAICFYIKCYYVCTNSTAIASRKNSTLAEVIFMRKRIAQVHKLWQTNEAINGDAHLPSFFYFTNFVKFAST